MNIIDEISKEILKKCSNEETPCSLIFSISESLEVFKKVIDIFTKHGFNIQDFVDDFMCVLSREREGINEAVKIIRNKIEIQALKNTIEELSIGLSEFYIPTKE
ncbi:MAG: hypothetical protein JXA54_16125 [Candidatus Heimdallarchaeota archaeon]|nr:hypothetical protein [Candidatus Heimdallarchaeota archaeon]